MIGIQYSLARAPAFLAARWYARVCAGRQARRCRLRRTALLEGGNAETRARHSVGVRGAAQKGEIRKRSTSAGIAEPDTQSSRARAPSRIESQAAARPDEAKGDRETKAKRKTTSARKTRSAHVVEIVLRLADARARNERLLISALRPRRGTFRVARRAFARGVRLEDDKRVVFAQTGRADDAALLHHTVLGSRDSAARDRRRCGSGRYAPCVIRSVCCPRSRRRIASRRSRSLLGAFPSPRTWLRDRGGRRMVSYA